MQLGFFVAIVINLHNAPGAAIHRRQNTEHMDHFLVLEGIEAVPEHLAINGQNLHLFYVTCSILTAKLSAVFAELALELAIVETLQNKPYTVNRCGSEQPDPLDAGLRRTLENHLPGDCSATFRCPSALAFWALRDLTEP